MRTRARVAVFVTVLIVAAAAAFSLRSGIAGLLNQEALFRYAARNLTETQKREFYASLASAIPASVWEAVPEPQVGRMLQFNTTKTDLRAELVTNAAGMRSQIPYVPKPPNTFRIVCLGDSMVMGTAGREEDRWGDQIQQILRELEVRIGGKQVEVYSLGVGSWSAINSATYLTHRISSYAPDLVLVMMVDNDLNDVGGVLGIGQVTYRFTSEHRDDGSAVFVDHWPQEFGIAERNLLASGFGTESRARWRSAFAAWKRLETIAGEGGGKMVLGVLRSSDLFMELVRKHAAEASLQSPILVTEYFGERLPHDMHPNRAGHRILAAHYLHFLSTLGWIPVERPRLPALHEGLTAETIGTIGTHDAAHLVSLQDELARSTLSERITFDALTPANVRSILGGIYPGDENRKLASFPFATVKSAFLLKRAMAARRVLVEIEVPDFVELYPLEIQMLVEGREAGRIALQSPRDAGRHVINGLIPSDATASPALEVTLRTNAYWATISDVTMRSFRLISARQE